jgi:multiple sugar transport system permease protein
MMKSPANTSSLAKDHSTHMTDGTFKVKESHWTSAATYAGLLLVSILFLTPLAWMVVTSFLTQEQAAQGPGVFVNGVTTFSPTGEKITAPIDPSSVPQQILRNYYGEHDESGVPIHRGVWTDDGVNFPLYLRNTLVVAILSVVGMTLSSAIVAYAFSRIQWRGRSAMFTLMLATMMIPFPVIMGPMFIIFSKLGWIGSLKPLWIPAWFGGAFNIFMLRQFFMGIPRDLDEAARLDGCGHWGIFWRVIMPLSTPALAVVSLFHFIYVWNDFLAPLIFLTHRDDFTLALGLQLYQSKAGNTPWNLLMAASTMVVAPVLLLFLIAQRQLIRGIAGDGLKE